MKVAIVHDWLVEYGGAEIVLMHFLRMFPSSHIYVLFYHPRWRQELSHTPISPSYLQKIPAITRYYRNFLPLFPRAIESLKPEEPLVISNSHSVAKGVIPRPEAFHLCYCYTPMRYAWDLENQYLHSLPAGIRSLAAGYLHRLRLWDFASSQRVDAFVAISHFVSKRIEKYFRRESQVIYPPVDVDFFCPPAEPKRGDFFLVVSRLVPYKGIETVIQVANRLNIRLKIVGKGPLKNTLRRMAGKNVEFLGKVEKGALRELYQTAQALLHPAVEDFGIVVVESIACGTPVISPARGGNAEIVEKCSAGVLYHNEEQLEEILKNWSAEAFSRQLLFPSAQYFSFPRFQKEFMNLLSSYGFTF